MDGGSHVNYMNCCSSGSSNTTNSVKAGFKGNEELCDEHTMLFQKPNVAFPFKGYRWFVNNEAAVFRNCV